MTDIRDRQIRLVHELMYQIKVQEVMTVNVVCFKPSSTFREIQLCMKEKRFTGTPIVDGGELQGIISIQDIITAFDLGRMNEPVGPYMSRDVMTIPQNYSVIAAANLFRKYRFGRLPVVDAPQSRRVVGIVTYSDIISHLLLEVNAIAERFEQQEGNRGQITWDSCNKMRFEIAPDNFDLAGSASTTVKKHLQGFGIAPALLRRISVICYESEMNVIIHSLGGYMEVEIEKDRVRILVVDEGPGIPDIEKAMQPGFTTANEKIRALGFGAGMGLCNIKQCADEFAIRSTMESGTELEAVVMLETPFDPAALIARNREAGAAGSGKGAP